MTNVLTQPSATAPFPLNTDVYPLSQNATPPKAPETPTGALEAIAIYRGVVVLSWNYGFASPASFVVERSEDGQAFKQCGTSCAEHAYFQDATVVPGTRYHYRVMAAPNGQSSAYSNIASAMASGAQAPKETIDTLMEQRQAVEDEAKKLQEENKRAAMRYVEILLRPELEEGDGEFLTEMMADPAIGMDEAQIRSDFELVKAIRIKRADAARHSPTIDSEKVKQLRAAEKAAELAAKETDLATRQYFASVSFAQDARVQLRYLAGQRPDLFEPATAGQLPRFLGED